MIFLIEYDRGRGEIITLKPFDNADRDLAEDIRLNRELAVNAEQLDHEIVMLEASSEEAVRKTHRRYFEDLSQLLESSETTQHSLLNSR